MKLTTIAGFGSICLLAGALGYLVGRPETNGHGEAAEERLEAVLGTGVAEPAADLVRIRDVSKLRPAIAAAVEAALEGMGGDPFAALASLRALEDDADRAEAIFELIGRMDAGQLRVLVTGLAAAGEGSPQAELLNEMFSSPFAPIAMFDRWAQLDPEAMIAFAVSPVEQVGRFEMPMLMRALAIAFIAQRDPDRAFEAADQLANDPLLQGDDAGAEAAMMIESVIGIGMAVSDPVASMRKMRERGLSVEAMRGIDPIFEMAGPHGAGVLEEIMLFPAGEGRSGLLGELFQAWGKYDLPLALASIANLPEGEDRTALMDGALRGAAQGDPAEAARMLHLLPGGEIREQAAEHIVEQWSMSEPVDALRWARENLPEMEFVRQLQQASERLPPSAAQDLVEGLSDEVRAQYFSETRISDPDHYVMRMVRDDPAAAIAWLEENGGLDSINGQVVGNILSAQGIESAIEFAATLPEAKWVDDYLASVATEAGRSGNLEWLEWARSQGGRAHASAVASWVREDPQAAAAYAAAAGLEQLSLAVGTWAQDDPAAAFRWTVEANAGDPERVGDVLRSGDLIGLWSRQDPVAAAEAMAGFPDDLAGGYLGSVIGSWASVEPSRASEYVAEHFAEGGAVRDSVVLSLVEQIKGGSPSEARAWAESISDDGMRATAIESLQLP